MNTPSFKIYKNIDKAVVQSGNGQIRVFTISDIADIAVEKGECEKWYVCFGVKNNKNIFVRGFVTEDAAMDFLNCFMFGWNSFFGGIDIYCWPLDEQNKLEDEQK